VQALQIARRSAQHPSVQCGLHGGGRRSAMTERQNTNKTKTAKHKKENSNT
jgi:hypothetical protein